MYYIILDEGKVIRVSDNKVVSPCQSAEDPDFIAYNNWVYEGNNPTIYETDPNK
jgi:hypothetical protein